MSGFGLAARQLYIITYEVIRVVSTGVWGEARCVTVCVGELVGCVLAHMTVEGSYI